MAGAIAALSPQRHWFANISLAERVLDIITEFRDTPWVTEETRKSIAGDRKVKVEKMQEAANFLFRNKSPKVRKARIAVIEGKTFAEVWNADYSEYGKKAKVVRQDAIGDYIRAFDVAHFDKYHLRTNPEGEFTGKWPTSIQWGSNAFIFKAANVIVDPSYENVSARMGLKHKLRNFFNNIIAPFYGTDGTMDTHAVNAGHLRPLGGESTEVELNFGGSVKGIPGGAASDATTGINGTYPLYIEAYRRAAERRDVLVREFQSIDWEAIRSLFGDDKKSAKKIEEIEGIWKDYQDGKLTIEDARERTFDAAGGFDDPGWGRRDKRLDEEYGGSTYLTELPRPRLDRSGLQEESPGSRGKVYDPGKHKPGVKGLCHSEGHEGLREASQDGR